MTRHFNFRLDRGAFRASKVLAAALLMIPMCALGGTFGTVVAIRGHAADIALDERRGVLYVANFGANRIEVMSLAKHTIGTSINVAPQPGSMALSPDGQFLLIAHFGAPSDDQALILPLLLKDKVAALVYADAGSDGHGKMDASALEVLVTATSAWLEVASLRKQAPKDGAGETGERPSAVPGCFRGEGRNAPAVRFHPLSKQRRIRASAPGPTG